MSTDSSANYVLIVDDDPYFCKLMQRLLTGMNHQSESASSGSIALEKVLERSPGVMFLDFNLPDISGPELAAKIRLTTPRTIIIGFSGCTEAEVQAYVENATFDFFHQKPMSLPELRNVLSSSLLQAETIRNARL